MTTVAVDPTGQAAPPASRPGRVIRSGAGRRPAVEKGRILAVVGIGAALVGGFATANTLLSGLAGPPPRPVIKMSTAAATWPDLRDGVPALASPPAAVAPAAPVQAPAPVARSTAAPAPAPETLRASLDPAPAPASPAPAKPSVKPLPIENAETVAPSREATLLSPSPRVAALVRPLASETVRARTAAASTFTSLEPEDTTASVADPAKTTEPSKAHVAREPAKPRARTAAAKPARAASGEAAPVAAASDAESDETEVLGLKVPTLAATGRKLREAFGGGDAPAAAAQ